MKNLNPPEKLPSSLYRYFWNVNPQEINPQKHWQSVISRILELGDERACHYVIRSFPRDMIIETIKNSRELSAKSATFWALIFNINQSDVKCLRKEFPNPPAKVWPY